MFPITRQDVEKLGKRPETVARFGNDRFHLGDEAYVGILEINHQVHCLNQLRKMAFADYPPYREQKGAKKQYGDLWWLHVRHCTDMLLQNILCHADADIVTYRWVDTAKYPQLDFSINKRCRDLGTIFDWRDRQRAHMNKSIGPEKPKNTKPIPAEKGYYEMFGYEGSELFDMDGQPLSA